MRNAIVVGGTCLVALLAFAATEKLQPLNAKTGLWQTTLTVKYTGLPPQMAEGMKPAMTYKSCVKPNDVKDLTSNPWMSGLKCSSWSVLKSAGTDLEVQGNACDMGHGLIASGHGNLHLQDSEHLTEVIDYTLTGSGLAVQGHAISTSKWIGATCPAETN